MVSKSRNKIHQTKGLPISGALYRHRGSTPYAPRGCHDGKVHLLCEDGGGEDDVDGGAEPLVGEEDGGGVEEEGGEAAEATEGEEQVHGGLPPPGVAAVQGTLHL